MPDITLRPAQQKDRDFAYEVKKAALWKYVDQTWGWDDAFQQAFHLKHFNPVNARIILLQGKAIGWLEVTRASAQIQIEQIYVLPKDQNQGIGTHVVKELLAEADEKSVPVKLRVLKANPAKRLYERLDFQVVGETATHFLMTRKVGRKVKPPA